MQHSAAQYRYKHYLFEIVPEPCPPGVAAVVWGQLPLEAAGHPLLLQELLHVQHVQTCDGSSGGDGDSGDGGSGGEVRYGKVRLVATIRRSGESQWKIGITATTTNVKQ